MTDLRKWIEEADKANILRRIKEETDVRRILRELRPAVHAKGTDYTAESVPEAELARELGTRVAIVGDPKDHDTSRFLEDLRKPKERG